ncbi:hypothetical protein VTI28DRAFT_3740 [Corynascus sepedonium]
MEHGAQTPGPTKKRRGRPRKAKNNTADTAIVLSDSEPGGSSPNQVDKKRPSDHPEVLSPAQSSKRPATSPSISIKATLFTREEIDRINQQLASERKLRAGAEKKQAELQAFLDQKNASWAADLAAQMTPLRLELQQLAKEKNDLADKYDEVLLRNAKLQGILVKNQESDVNANKLGPAASEKPSYQVTDTHLVETKECLVRAERQLLDKDAEIIELRHNINVKEKTISTLNENLTESNKSWIEAENKWRKAADELTALGAIRREVEEKLNIVQQTLAMTETDRRECEAKTEQQLAIMAKKQKQREVQLKAKEEHLEEIEELLRQSKEIINGLKRENTTMVEQIQAQSEEIGALQESIAALEQEKQQLTHAVADNGSFPHRERLNNMRKLVTMLRVWKLAFATQLLEEVKEVLLHRLLRLSAGIPTLKELIVPLPTQIFYPLLLLDQQRPEPRQNLLGQEIKKIRMRYPFTMPTGLAGPGGGGVWLVVRRAYREPIKTI